MNIDNDTLIDVQAFAAWILEMLIAACQAFVAQIADLADSRPEAEAILKLRLDPVRYLGGFFNNPELLLKMMREVMFILSVSRAADYFVPGLATASSDLDFYTRKELASLVMFCLHHLGVRWDKLPKRSASEGFVDFTSAGFDVIYGALRAPTGIEYTIQLICGKSCMPSGCIFHFHSTITQCFFTGFAAVSPYYA